MIEMGRVRFWRERPFLRNRRTGEHFAVESYNPLTDRVTYRFGRHGTSPLGPYPTMSRGAYLALTDQGYEVKK